MFDALIQLMSIELHWYEEWDPAQTTPDAAADIVKHWIVPALKCCQFRESPVDEVRREITARMESTKWFFQHSRDQPRRGSTSTMSASRMMFGHLRPMRQSSQGRSCARNGMTWTSSTRRSATSAG